MEENKLTQKDLYDKAYAYFEYHAGQRMNMLNYFIAVFGACVALYGSFFGEDAPGQRLDRSIFMLHHGAVSQDRHPQPV